MLVHKKRLWNTSVCTKEKGGGVQKQERQESKEGKEGDVWGWGLGVARGRFPLPRASQLWPLGPLGALPSAHPTFILFFRPLPPVLHCQEKQEIAPSSSRLELFWAWPPVSGQSRRGRDTVRVHVRDATQRPPLSCRRRKTLFKASAMLWCLKKKNAKHLYKHSSFTAGAHIYTGA